MPIGIDIFSGAGGLSLGAEMAGVRIKFAVERDWSAADTYEHNHSATIMLRDDIHNIHPLEHVEENEPVFIVFGGPPCKGFSTSNTKTRNCLNPNNSLFEEFVRFVHNLNPEWFLFENLISNSIKAMRDTTDKVIKCTGAVEDDKMSIRFSDNGCGILEEDWESVFEIFKTTTQNEGGVGIGLFTVKKRIEALNGEVKVVKPEFVNHGSTFLITLPFKR